jgi:hypothetical protein
MPIESKFFISPDIFEKCTKFARDSVSTSLDKYARRNQFDVEKIVKDIRNGKIGEEGVWEKVSKLYPDLSQPDHKIYQKKDKSWSPDLSDDQADFKLAVKSQDIDSSLAFGESWVFQFGNGGKYDCDSAVFKESDPNHYVAFVSLNVPKRTGEIKAIVKIQWLHDKKLFKEMQKASLRGNKVAVYYEDLEKYNDQLFQLGDK